MVGGYLRVPPASFTIKTSRHDIAGILLKVALNTINKSINQSNSLAPIITFISYSHNQNIGKLKILQEFLIAS